MAKKYLVQGNYQYSEANIKDANALRSFGWLIGRKTEHQNKKGEKVFTIRRDLEIANDPIVKKNEVIYLKNNGKAQKKMTRRHRWGQFFAILYMILFVVDAALFAFGDKLAFLVDVINPEKARVIDFLTGTAGLEAGLVDTIIGLYWIVYAVAAVICLVSIFVNNSRYKKRMVLPKRKYCKKYISLARNSMVAANERVYALKLDNRALMTKNDKKLADLGTTMERVMDRTTADDYE